MNKFLNKYHPVPSSPQKSVKTNKIQSIISKKFNLTSRWKSYHRLPWTRRDAAVHQRRSNIRVVISKFNGWNSKIHWGLSMIRYFPRGELSYVIVGEVKNQKRFSSRSDFTKRFSPGWIQPGYWDRVSFDRYCLFTFLL